MQTLWFILVAFMLIMYVVLDGFDLGAGIIHLFVARNDSERRMVLRAIGPVWDGNEVWIIAAGGTLFFTFPLLYASSFSGFYLPLIIVLWLLMWRGVSIEIRSRVPSPLWASFWDVMFFIGSILLALFYGAALANVIRGVSLDKNGVFFAPLWTTFSPFSAQTGILDWYTVLIGLLATATLTAHGANYIARKTEGDLNVRARRAAFIAWLVTIALGIASTIATFVVQPRIFASFNERPWGIVFPLLAFAGLVGMGYFNFKKQDLSAFFSSCAFIVAMLASSAFGVYPEVLPAVNPAYSLTIYNASAGQYGLTVGLIWWCIGIVLAIIYFTLTYRLFWGKVSAKGDYGHY
jgi:cytochrome d ubiquinol oxidase subunit II